MPRSKQMTVTISAVLTTRICLYLAREDPPELKVLSDDVEAIITGSKSYIRNALRRICLIILLSKRVLQSQPRVQP